MMGDFMVQHERIKYCWWSWWCVPIAVLPKGQRHAKASAWTWTMQVDVRGLYGHAIMLMSLPRWRQQWRYFLTSPPPTLTQLPLHFGTKNIVPLFCSLTRDTNMHCFSKRLFAPVLCLFSGYLWLDVKTVKSKLNQFNYLISSDLITTENQMRPKSATSAAPTCSCCMKASRSSIITPPQLIPKEPES